MACQRSSARCRAKFVACGVVARRPKSRQLGEPIGLHAKNFCMSDRHEVLAGVAAANGTPAERILVGPLVHTH